MDPAIDLNAPSHGREEPPRPLSLRQRLGARTRVAGARIVLWLHRQAERLDLVPAEFGDETPVDPSDGGALAREWLRQARQWAAYNPEEMLALKAGAALLAAALVALILIVAAIG